MNCRSSLLVILLILCTVIAGCGSFATYRVKKGETLYSIGWKYGHDYRDIAAWNGLQPPYTIYKGQRLRLTPPAGWPALLPRHRANQAPVINAPSANTAAKKGPPKKGRPRLKKKSPPAPPAVVIPRVLKWSWPIQGKLVHRFSKSVLGNKGIDIAGRLNQPVYASAGGQVVYSGSGLINYGKLVIIKHNDSYLSAYGYNNRLLVTEGDQVRSGQHIADMGRGAHMNVMLHFEIRRNGKPVDPLRYLP